MRTASNQDARRSTRRTLRADTPRSLSGWLGDPGAGALHWSALNKHQFVSKTLRFNVVQINMYSTAHARDRPSLGPNGNAPKYTQEARLHHTRHGPTPTRDANSSSSARRRRRPGRKVFRTLALCHARARRRPPHGSHCVAHDAASAQTARALGATQGAHAQQCDTAVGRRPQPS